MRHPSHISNRLQLAAIFGLLMTLVTPALAHNGPPFPIITDKQIGPCVVSLWTHPDIGTGAFYVIVNQKQSQPACPQDPHFEVGVAPSSGRLAEKRYATWRDAVRNQLQYKTEVAFDQQELWKVHLILHGPQGDADAMATVTPTPPGLGRWDLLFYASPFLLVAVLWVRAMARRKRRSA